MATPVEEIRNQLEHRKQQLLVDSLRSQLDTRKAELSKTENAGSAFGQMVGRSSMDALLQSPKLLAMGAAGVQAPFSERNFSEIFQEGKQKFPANLAFTTNEFGAFARSLPEMFTQRPPDQPGVENPTPLFTERFGDRFGEELLRINPEEERLRQKFPKATRAGDIGGNVLAFMGGRLPFLSKIDKAEKFLAGKKFADAIKNPGVAGELGNLAKGLIDSKGMRSFMRGAGRATEAGLEAAVLEAVKGDDPLRAAAYVAGGQAIGSVLLNASHGVRTGGFLKAGLRFATLGAAYTGIIQMLKSSVPGGENDLLESGKEAFFHLAMLMMAGGVASIAGAGRARGTKFDEVLPRVAEIVSTIPRATMISFATGYINATPDEQQTIDATLQQLQQDPEFFGPEIAEKLLKAFESGNLVKALREPAERVQEFAGAVKQQGNEVIGGLQQTVADLPLREIGEQSINQLQQVVDSLPEKATTAFQAAVNKARDELEKLEKRKRFQQPTAGFDKLFK